MPKKMELMPMPFDICIHPCPELALTLLQYRHLKSLSPLVQSFFNNFFSFHDPEPPCAFSIFITFSTFPFLFSVTTISLCYSAFLSSDDEFTPCLLNPSLPFLSGALQFGFRHFIPVELFSLKSWTTFFQAGQTAPSPGSCSMIFPPPWIQRITPFLETSMALVYLPSLKWAPSAIDYAGRSMMMIIINGVNSITNYTVVCPLRPQSHTLERSAGRQFPLWLMSAAAWLLEMAFRMASAV